MHYTLCKINFNTEVELATLTERKQLAELSAHHQLISAQISRCKLHVPLGGLAGTHLPTYFGDSHAHICLA
jgi:hypothetical protein